MRAFAAHGRRESRAETTDSSRACVRKARRSPPRLTALAALAARKRAIVPVIFDFAHACFCVAAAARATAAAAHAAHRIHATSAATTIRDALLGLTRAARRVAAFSAATRATTRTANRIQTAAPAAAIRNAGRLALTGCFIAHLARRARSAAHAAHGIQTAGQPAAVRRALTGFDRRQRFRAGLGVAARLDGRTGAKNQARQNESATKNARDVHDQRGSSRGGCARTAPCPR